jgi:excisionase family DNA binding protein
MAQSEHDSKLLTIRSAANYLGLSASTLRKMEKKGLLIPYHTPGGHRRYTLQMLDKYLEDSGKRRSKQGTP